MRKITSLIFLFIASTALLTGCDNAEHARKKRCTELQNEATHAFHGEGKRKLSEVRKEWDSLKCEQTDIIHG